MQAHSFVIIIKTFPLRPWLVDLDVLWPSKPQSIISKQLGSFKSQSWIATWSSLEWFWKGFNSFPHSSYLVWKCISLHQTHVMFQPFFWLILHFRVVGKEAFDVISSSSIKCHLVQCYVGLFFTQIYPLHMCRVYFFKLIYLKKKITFFHMQKTSLVTYI